MSWIVGVDGGGSKTSILAWRTDAEEVRSICSQSICPVDYGVDGFREVLTGAFEELGIDRVEVTAVCLGVPCFGEFAETDARVRAAASELFPNADVRCENDGFVGFAGAFGLKPGINVVSGTGAIIYGVDDGGNHARSNGWHPAFSDEGSGAWLGREAFSLFAKQADGRRKRTELYDLFRKELNLTRDVDIISFYNANCSSRKELASYQQLLLMAARMGDRSAVDLYARAAHELCESVLAVYQRLDFRGPLKVSYSGGCFRADNYLLGPFTDELKIRIQGCKILEPLYSPEHGALLAAKALLNMKG